MEIKQIVFHAFDKSQLLRQVRKAKPLLLPGVKISVLDTPKSTTRDILHKAGLDFTKIYDFNADIQKCGMAYSQDWINFVFSQQKCHIWNSLVIRNCLVRPFQYSTLMNRNREVRYPFDDVVRLMVIAKRIKNRGSCLVISSDPYFLATCRSMGFLVMRDNLRKQMVNMYLKGFCTNFIKRLLFCLILLYVKYLTKDVTIQHEEKFSRENVWYATTYLPGLVSEKTGHDERYRDVAEDIESETDTRLVYAGWISTRKELLHLKQILRRISQKGVCAIPVTNYLSSAMIFNYLIPSKIVTALRIFFKHRDDFNQQFNKIPMRYFLEREFCNTFVCTGDSNESFYYYHLVENNYLRLFSKIKPKMVTTFLEGYNFGRAVIAACRYLDIPVLGWQESVLHPMRLYYRWSAESIEQDLPSRNTEIGYLYPDAYCVWSKDTKDFLVKKGMSTRHIIVIGATRYRNFMKQVLASNEMGRHSRGNNILVVGTAFLNESIAMMDFMEEAICDTLDVSVLFRPHPQTKTYFQTRWAERYNNRISISRNSLNENLEWSDIVISSWSTMLCEALLMGKTCISIFTAGWISQPPLTEEMCYYFTDSDKLKFWLTEGKAIKQDKSKIKEVAIRLLGSPDVNSGKVIEKFIENVLSPLQ
jgi:hypothetical protein